MLVSLYSRPEKVDVGFEGRLERFVPILEIRQNRKCIRSQRVHSRLECIRGFALIYEKRQLRVAHREFAAVLNFPVLH